MTAFERVVVASTFTATPISSALEAVLPGVEVSFSLYGALAPALLRTDTSTSRTIFIVLVRVEDWLRDDPPPENDETWQARLREKLRARVDELIEQIAVSARSRPTLFLCCPSQGAVATKHKLASRCQTHSSLLVAGAEARTSAQILHWQDLPELPENAFDRASDRMGQVPFSQPCFDALGRWLAKKVIAASEGVVPDAARDTPSPELLARFLSSLDLGLEFARSTVEDADDLEGLVRAGTEFRLHRDQRSADDLRALVARPDSELLRIAVHDRFGHFPKAGLVELQRGKDLVVRQLVLTCPVLGKQVEHGLLVALARLARRESADRIRMRCEPGPDTALAHEFLGAIERLAGQTPSGDEVNLPVAGLEEVVLRHSVAPQAVSQSLRNELGELKTS